MSCSREMHALWLCVLLPLGWVAAQDPLPGTAPLTMDGDIASTLVDGVDRFLLRELEKSVAAREQFWHRDMSSKENYVKSLEANRARLAHILGVRDPRVPGVFPELLDGPGRPALLARGETCEVFAIRWPVVRDIQAEGLLLVPRGEVLGDAVYLPDADQTPEQLCGLMEGKGEGGPVNAGLSRLVGDRFRVVIPAALSRRMVQRNGRSTVSQREFIYRSAFELGRHLQGYEIQGALALVDWFESEAKGAERKIVVHGYGEGGLIALQAAALDTRIDEVDISGCFGNRQRVWEQPIDRNVFGLLEQFGDAELATMVAPRRLTIGDEPGPTVELSGAGGGAPAKLAGPTPDEVAAEIARTRSLVGPLGDQWLVHRRLSEPAPASPPVRFEVLQALPDAVAREERLFHAYDVHQQWLLQESPFVRAEFMKQLDTTSVEKYQASVEHYRKIFREEVIGAFPYPLLPFGARTRKIEENDRWTRYEVVLDVWEDVIAYGLLTLPKGIPAGEKRPVVVCQHGLEGRPQSVIGEQDFQYYKAFATQLAERGFITFAPQNLYIFRDRFRTLQRKANPLKKTLFSIIVPQHQQIVNWLKTQPQVDGERIAFYGLSYGGKSAMRIPPLVTDYCLSICSADFNEWVAKNASTRLPFSYVWTGEYEIFEFDLGSTFNYSEMAALICPRPFMVERGHTDGVSTDEWVAYEFAKVRFLYSHRLKIPERTEMEVFDGPHSINGQGTYEFLHRHLRWPKPTASR